MAQFILAAAAESNLDEIWLYIAGESGSAARADKVIERLLKGISILAANPRIGIRCDPSIDLAGRWFPMEAYIVYYRTKRSHILVTHVFDGRRDQRTAWVAKDL